VLDHNTSVIDKFMDSIQGMVEMNKKAYQDGYINGREDVLSGYNQSPDLVHFPTTVDAAVDTDFGDAAVDAGVDVTKDVAEDAAVDTSEDAAEDTAKDAAGEEIYWVLGALGTLILLYLDCIPQQFSIFPFLTICFRFCYCCLCGIAW
jgi:hypothetical protein